MVIRSSRDRLKVFDSKQTDRKKEVKGVYGLYDDWVWRLCMIGCGCCAWLGVMIWMIWLIVCIDHMSFFLIKLDEYGTHVVHAVLISAILGDKLI